MDLPGAVRRIEAFRGDSLTTRLASLEKAFAGIGPLEAKDLCQAEHLGSTLLDAASDLKQVAAQIDVVIHAIGILVALPSILDETEVVEYLSLGAGNTGRAFDLETNRRIAEFKFINWKDKANAIRQNSVFKDFYFLAEHDTSKDRFLYVLGLSEPLKFLNGRRSLKSVMNATLARSFRKQYDTRFSVVREYYHFRKDRVQIVDLIPVLPGLAHLEILAPGPE